MDEERVKLFTARLLSVLAAELPPDAAGSRAIALALIAAQAEGASEPGTSAVDPDDLLARDIHLLPVLAAELTPDAAGSRAIALALIAVQAEAASAPGTPAGDADDSLARDIHLLPAFIAQAQDACDDDLVTLVRRFVQGERPRLAGDPIPPDSARSARRARLRELQRWGVDLSLIETTMAQTPAVRIATMERQLLLVRQLRGAKREQEAADD